MSRPTCPPIVALIALGCAAPAATAVPRSAAPLQDETREAPIRFGDPQGLYDEPFFPGATYDEAIPTPDAILGSAHATRLSHHAEILACYRAWAAASPRVTLGSYGTTHEGRELVYAVITSPENHARLDAIRADLARLDDPRGLSEAEAESIVSSSPAVAWMGYSIHGDELSGSDASVAVGYHLAASTDDDVAELLQNVVVVVDPCLNPDGRERIVAMVEQSAGRTPSYDYASMHRGHWPFGRGNHYLFDMNRDWMAGTQPETRGRWRVAGSFHPQLFVDAHEMWSLDTFLFYPQNRPLNPALPAKLVEWQRRYAEGAAAAFDRRGWSYYSREWADAWAPFYSDSWGALLGATGILYEQAATYGSPLRRPSGELLTYREAVHHQVVASIANLTTLASRRQQALADYLENQRANVAAETPGNERMFVVEPAPNTEREAELLRILAGQRIEAIRVESEFSATNVVDRFHAASDEHVFPAGSIVVHARQPRRQMVRAYLDFDVRMEKEDLQREREGLERKGESTIYDMTAWSLVHALDLDAYWCDTAEVAGQRVGAPSDVEPSIVGAGPAVAWVVPASGDAVVSFAARALEGRLQVNASDKEFTLEVDGELVTVPPGSMLVRAVENEGDAALVEGKVLRAASAAGVRTVYRAGTGLAPGAAPWDSPDLGGGHFQLLSRPRVALLANAPVSSDTYGHLWFHLDTELGVPFAFLDAQRLAGYDLRRYNVIVLPPHSGGLVPILEANLEALTTWVEGGGTLIACGNSAAALTSGRLGLSAVTLRRDALEDLAPYYLAVDREWSAREVEIDEADVWGDPLPQAEDEAEEEAGDEDVEDPYEAEEVPAEHDTWLRLFSPRGVTLRGVVDPDAWIARGAGEEIPVLFSGSNVFLSRSPVKTAVRLAEEFELRLGGLVWPEARERIAESAWLTVESRGEGQIVLFAAVPGFRGYHKATARLFANAVVLGPGLGANQPSGW